MHVARLRPERGDGDGEAVRLGAFDDLLATLRMNGQLQGREFPIAHMRGGYEAYALLSQADALQANRLNVYLRHWLTTLQVGVGSGLNVSIIGHGPESAPVCACASTEAYILSTSAYSLESPLRCGACFGRIPVYRIPSAYQQEYADVLTWQSNYAATDLLWINSDPLERAAHRQLTRHNSALSVQGRDVCRAIELQTSSPTYYVLLHATLAGTPRNPKRSCPSCGGNWRIVDRWHDMFSARCDVCHLLG